MTSRFLLIPNTDSSISYTESWITASSTQFDSLGNFGPPFQSTLHGLIAASGSFSYFFHGSSIDVLGTIFVNNSEARGSSWGCFIDGVSLGPPVFPDITENNWSLCQQNLPDGPHELQVVVNSTTDPLYVDYFLFAPSVGISLENTTTYLASNDTSVSFDSTWSASQNAELTSAPEGKVVISFTGDSLDYYGFIPVNFSHTSSSAQYSIDDQSFTTFTLPGFNSNSSSDPQQDVLNQKFFSTGPLTQGSHTLTVRNNGNSNVTPLTFSFALISNGTSTSSSGSNPNLPPIPALINHHHSNHSAGIIGGVAAGAAVAAIIVISLVIWLVRRKFRSRIRLAEDTQLPGASTIDHLNITPFHVSTPAPSTSIAAPATSTVPAPMLTYGGSRPIRSNTIPTQERVSTETSIPSRSNTVTLHPRVSMSVSLPSQQGSSSSQSQTQTLVRGSSATSSTLKAGTVTVANSSTSSSRRRATSLLSEFPEQTVMSRPASQHMSANEITPMLEDNEEMDDEENYDGPPPTYTSRADNNINSEKFQQHLVHQNR